MLNTNGRISPLLALEIMFHAHLLVMTNLPLKFHLIHLNGLGEVSKIFIHKSRKLNSLHFCTYQTTIFFLHSHLNIFSNLPLKFRRNPFNGLEGVTLLKYLDKQPDRQTD